MFCNKKKKMNSYKYIKIKLNKYQAMFSFSSVDSEDLIYPRSPTVCVCGINTNE